MATVYVNNQATGGADDGSSEADGFLTIDQAMNWVTTAGTGPHKIWVKGGTDYTETVTIDTAGSSNGWIDVEGYSSTTGDGGKFTIDAESSRPNCLTISGIGQAYYRIRNGIFERATNTGAGCNTQRILFQDCEANNNAVGGFFIGYDSAIYACSADGNGGRGFQTGGARAWVAFCVASNNGDHGFMTTNVLFCKMLSNAGSGNYMGGGIFVNNTIDGDAQDTDFGITYGGIPPVLIANNIFYDCTTGIDTTNPGSYEVVIRNNLLNSNTTDYNTTVPSSEQGYDITSAPDFVDEVNGDYRLNTTSPARNAGTDASGTSGNGMDIGAHQSEDEGSGTRIVMAG